MAIQEYFARLRRLGLPEYRDLPLLMAFVDCDISQVLDLTRSDVAAVVQPFLDAETEHWRVMQKTHEAVTQAIGRAAKEVCFRGIIAPSVDVKPDGCNYVLFHDKFASTDKVRAPVIPDVTGSPSLLIY